MRCPGWCPKCYSNARGRTNFRGHFAFRVVKSIYSVEVTMAMKRPATRPAADEGPQDPLDGGLLAEYEMLWQFLVDDRWDDGSPRMLPTLLLFRGENGLTVALNDRDGQQTVFKSGRPLEGLLKALEEGLQEGTLEWRPSLAAKNRKQGRK